MVSGLARRRKIGMYHVNCLLMKISGKISNEEFQRRIHRQPDEQISLGIGASTEGPEGKGKR